MTDAAMNEIISYGNYPINTWIQDPHLKIFILTAGARQFIEYDTETFMFDSTNRFIRIKYINKIIDSEGNVTYEDVNGGITDVYLEYDYIAGVSFK